MDERAWARVIAQRERTMIETVNIGHRAETGDGAGGTTATYTWENNVPAKVAPMGLKKTDRLIAERLGKVEAWTVTVPVTVNMLPFDLVEYQGSMYMVHEIIGHHTHPTAARATITTVTP